MKEFNQQFSTLRLREELEGQYDKVLFSTNDAQLDNLLNTKFYDQLENEGDYYSLDADTFGKFEDLAFSMGFNMTDIVKKENVDEEGSVTGAGEAYLPGLDVPEKKYKAGYTQKVEEEKDVEPKLAAGNTKNIMKGWEDAPSIPNRPSKGGFIYKQLFEYLKENKEEFKTGDIVKYNGKDWKVIKVLRDGDMYKLEKDGIQTNVSLNVLKSRQKENLKEGIKTEIAKRNKSQQFNEAAKLANKKLKEVNAILEYASKLKLELHETGNTPTNRLMEKIKLSVVEAYKKIKEL
jgi:predicted DNA-binding antitoxin AbrB/MazE fold protein